MRFARRMTLTALAALPLVGCEWTGQISLEPTLTEVTVTGWGEGSGRIVGAPDIACIYDGARSFGSCTARVTPGTTLSLEAIPNDTTTEGPAFELWAGDCTGPQGTKCLVGVGEESLTVSAGFPAVTHVQGRIFLPPGAQADLSHLAVSLSVDRKVMGSTPVNALGFYRGAILGSLRQVPEVDVVVDVRPEFARELYPTYIGLRPWRLADPLDVVAIPMEFTIPSGTYAGQTVHISLDEALGTKPPFYRYTGRQPIGQPWEFQVQSVTLDQLPLTLAFDFGRSTEKILAIDVERYWRRIHELETAVGFQLFEPTHDVGSAQVQIVLRTDFCAGATACTGLGSGDPYLSGQAQVFHTSVEQFRDGRRIVGHELIHVLGMGHTCSWVSVMSLSDLECEAPVSSDVPTVRDMAYLLLTLHVNSLQAKHSMPSFSAGVFGAWNGQRVLLLGKEPWNLQLSTYGAELIGWDGFSSP